MPSRRSVPALVAILAVTLFACQSGEPTSPDVSSRAHERGASEWDGRRIPGAYRPSDAGDGDHDDDEHGLVVACTRRDPRVGSAVIGPQGGTLVVGRNRLVIPAGALTEPTLITGTVPADTIASIHFEPAGLHFSKPAGLVLDANGCGPTGEHPSILYLSDEGAVLERIDAFYSNWWHTVAAPISHFSVYAIGI